MTRWKIIPTQRNRGAEFVHGSPLDALNAAQMMADERGCKVMVVEHPEDGLIRPIATVGKNPEKKTRREEQAA